jgi:transcriptional regulator with XRE-family HTH domain
MSRRTASRTCAGFSKIGGRASRPADVGLALTPRRRVRGLRREEVAALAGIGISWYTALENGDAEGVSETTLRAVAEALRLTESERDYLLELAAQSDDLREGSNARYGRRERGRVTEGCPVNGHLKRTIVGARSNQDWWPNQLNLKLLHQNSPLSDPMGPEFNYAEEFKSLDLDA